MAYQDDILNEQQQGPSAAVLGPQAQGGMSAPLEGSQPSQQGGATGATIQSESGSQGGSQPQRTPSSGRFVNLRRYVDANRPATQRMTGAVEQNVLGQASQIGQQIDQQKQQLANQVAQNRQQFGQQQQQSQNILQQAQRTGRLTQADIDRFRSFTGGGRQLSNIDAAKQFEDERGGVGRIEGFQQQSKSAPGRTELLRQTFARPDKRYTRGMIGLDSLLMEGDSSASGRLSTAFDDPSKQLRSRFETARSGAISDIDRFGREEATGRRTLGQQATTQAQENLMRLQREVADQERRRQELLPQLQEQQERLRGISEGRDTDLRSRDYDDYIKAMTSNRALAAINRAINPGLSDEQRRRALSDIAGRDINLSDITSRDVDMRGMNLQNYLESLVDADTERRLFGTGRGYLTSVDTPNYSRGGAAALGNLSELLDFARGRSEQLADFRSLTPEERAGMEQVLAADPRAFEREIGIQNLAADQLAVQNALAQLTGRGDLGIQASEYSPVGSLQSLLDTASGIEARYPELGDQFGDQTGNAYLYQSDRARDFQDLFRAPAADNFVLPTGVA